MMRNTTITNLGQVRALLGELDKARGAILNGTVTSFFALMQESDGKETSCAAGVYKEDPRAAARAALKITATKTLTEDEAPQQFAASNF